VKGTVKTHIGTAFVPAAGLGTRMRHLREDKPKPLIKVAGRSLLDRVLDRLAEAGIARAVVNVHYKADQIEKSLANRGTPEIIISDEREALLETGGGLVKALPLIGDAAIMIHNSDSIWIETGAKPALEKLKSEWDPRRMDCLMLLADRTTAIGFDGPGDFVMDPEGRLERRGNHTTTPLVFTGVSINHPRLLENAPDGAFSLNLLWDRAITAGRLFGTLLEGRWMHVGTPEAVAAAESILSNETTN